MTKKHLRCPPRIAHHPVHPPQHPVGSRSQAGQHPGALGTLSSSATAGDPRAVWMLVSKSNQLGKKNRHKITIGHIVYTSPVSLGPSYLIWQIDFFPAWHWAFSKWAQSLRIYNVWFSWWFNLTSAWKFCFRKSLELFCFAWRHGNNSWNVIEAQTVQRSSCQCWRLWQSQHSQSWVPDGGFVWVWD